MTGRSTVIGERGRRAWYQLEGRHTTLLTGRLTLILAVVAGTALMPPDLPTREVQALYVACGAAAVAQVLLWLASRRWPKTLGPLVWASIVTDVLWAAAVADATGGPDGPLAGALLIVALGAAVGYSATAGMVAGALATLAYLGMLARVDADPLAPASWAPMLFFWAALAFAVLGAAAGERELRLRAGRLAVLHAAGQTLLTESDPERMVVVARDAARELMPDWEVRLRPGVAPGQVRVGRVGLDGVVVVPIGGQERTLGIIECRRPLAAGLVCHTVRLREITALETLASSLAGGLLRAELLLTIQRQSLTDALTGLGNRRAFDRELERRVAASRRSGRPVSVCLFDIDHFKDYNDSFGHPAGDQALAAVARTLRTNSRAADIPARYGGEEMVLILPDTPLERAVEVAERVRAAVEAQPMEHRTVTVSAGVSATAGECSAEVVLEAADRALYLAKEEGRNRVRWGRASTPSPEHSSG